MRDIRFRGKREDEWFYGDLITVDGDSFIFDDGEWNFVDPETVGEYTGLTDKNGTKVFEGDIVKFYTQGNETRGVVFWDSFARDRTIGFAIGSGSSTFTLNPIKNVEVIGNKWDNADLLEGENE